MLRPRPKRGCGPGAASPAQETFLLFHPNHQGLSGGPFILRPRPKRGCRPEASSPAQETFLLFGYQSIMIHPGSGSRLRKTQGFRKTLRLLSGMAQNHERKSKVGFEDTDSIPTYRTCHDSLGIQWNPYTISNLCWDVILVLEFY